MVKMKDFHGNDQFSPVTAKRAPDMVYNKICAMIFQGNLKPHDKLPSERNMMQLFKRSQATIREAMGMLETNGYVTINPGDGAYVNEITLQPIIPLLIEFIDFRKVSFLEIFEFVKEIESAFARQYCLLRNDSDLLQLITTLDLIRSQAKTPAMLHRSVFIFHKQLMVTASNPIATIIWETIHRLLQNRENPGNWLNTLEPSYVVMMHDKIYSALSARREPELQKTLSEFWTSVLKNHTVMNSVSRDARDAGILPDGEMTPFNVPKISDMVYDQIKSKILNSELTAGEKLPPERELIKSFQCSRPSIREALRKLENAGCITIVQGSGAVVNEFTSYPLERTLQNVIRMRLVTGEHLISIRNVCDTLAVQWAVERRTSSDLCAIKNILDKAKLSLNFIEKSVDFSKEYHDCFAVASHNRLLCIVSQIIWAVIFDRIVAHLHNLDTASAEAIILKDYEQHYLLYEAIENRDLEHAKRNALNHIEFVTAQVD